MGSIPRKTKLGHYLEKQFTFTFKGTAKTIHGQAFILPGSSFSRTYRISPSPVGNPCLEVTIPGMKRGINRPVYCRITARKEVDKQVTGRLTRNREITAGYNMIVDDFEEIPVEDLRDKIYPRARNTAGELTPSGIDYAYFRSQLLKDIEEYSNPGIYREIKELILDGMEIGGKEDLLPLIAVSSSPRETDGRLTSAGGFHVAMVGKLRKGIAATEKRIEAVTHEPVLKEMRYWNSFKASTEGTEQGSALGKRASRGNMLFSSGGRKKLIAAWKENWSSYRLITHCR